MAEKDQLLHLNSLSFNICMCVYFAWVVTHFSLLFLNELVDVMYVSMPMIWRANYLIQHIRLLSGTVSCNIVLLTKVDKFTCSESFYFIFFFNFWNGCGNWSVEINFTQLHNFHQKWENYLGKNLKKCLCDCNTIFNFGKLQFLQYTVPWQNAIMEVLRTSEVLFPWRYSQLSVFCALPEAVHYVTVTRQAASYSIQLSVKSLFIKNSHGSQYIIKLEGRREVVFWTMNMVT